MYNINYTDIFHLKCLILQEINELKALNKNPDLQYLNNLYHKMETFNSTISEERINELEEKIKQLEERVNALEYVTDTSIYYE